MIMYSVLCVPDHSSIMASTPNPVNRHHQPASVHEFQNWFDGDGRLVKEAVMRQCLFEGWYFSLYTHTIVYIWVDQLDQ